MTRKQLLSIVDKTFIIGAIITCAVVFYFGNTGDQTINHQPINWALLSCMLLCSIIVHLFCSVFSSFEQKEIEAKIAQSVIDINAKTVQTFSTIDEKFDQVSTTIIDALGVTAKKTFKNITEADHYVAKRIKEAKHCVADLNWQDFQVVTPAHPRQNRQQTDNEIDNSIKFFCEKHKSSLSDCKYEEIFTFPESNKANLSKMKRHITYGAIYNCYYYDTSPPNKKFPKLQFVIIDKKEIIFVSREYLGNLCAIVDDRLIAIFENYFEQAKTLSIPIKFSGESADDSELLIIERKFGSGTPNGEPEATG